jgi:uncharacterized protein YegL
MSGLLRPGGSLAARPLQFIWIVDGSGSMKGEKIQSLNFAIRSAIPAMREEAAKNPNTSLLVRAVRFADTATWHVPTPTPVQNFAWPDLTAGGTTAMGSALNLVAQALAEAPEGGRGMAPVLVLLTDGHPTDDFAAGLSHLMSLDLGRAAIRLGIAIGADADKKKLAEFVGDPDRPVLEAQNSDSLVAFIKFASTVLVNQGARPRIAGDARPGFIIPPPTATQTSSDVLW